MKKRHKGVAIVVVAVIAIACIYGMRPPSGFGDAIMMMGQGKSTYIKEPLYQILLSISGLGLFYGLYLAGSNWNKED